MNNENNNLNLMADFENATIEEPKKEKVTKVEPVKEEPKAVEEQPTTTKEIEPAEPIADIQPETKEPEEKQTVLTAKEKVIDEKPWPFIVGVFAAVAIFILVMPLLFKLISMK